MAFVPEGQADSSQAQSAWSHEKTSPVPAGRLNGSRLRLGARQEDVITSGGAALRCDSIAQLKEMVSPQGYSPGT